MNRTQQGAVEGPLAGALVDGRRRILIIDVGHRLRRHPILAVVLAGVLVVPPLVANRPEELTVVGRAAAGGVLYLCLAHWNAASSWAGFTRAGRRLSGRYRGPDAEAAAAAQVWRIYGRLQVASTAAGTAALLAVAAVVHETGVLPVYRPGNVPLTVTTAAVTATSAYWLIVTPYLLGKLIGKRSGLEPLWYDPAGDPALLGFSTTFGLATVKAGAAFLVINVGIGLLNPDAWGDVAVRGGVALAMLIIFALLVLPQAIVASVLRRHRAVVLDRLREALGPTPRLTDPSPALDLYMFVAQRGILRGNAATFGEYLIALAAAVLPLTDIIGPQGSR